MLEDPRWWAALTLEERWTGTGISADLDRGWLRLRLWKEGRLAPGYRVSLEARVAACGGTPHRLAALLGEPVRELRQRLPEVPAWLRVLADAWPVAGTIDGDCLCGGAAPDTADVSDPDAALLRWIEPLTSWAGERLRRSLPEPLPPGHPLLLPDRDTLLVMIKRVMALEVNVAREQGSLCGRTPQARFGCFARGLARPLVGLDLLGRYPVLARQLVEHAESWVEARRELADRLRADLPELAARFGVVARGMADVTAVRFGAGDPHRGGRSVVILEVGGQKVVYKPRSLAVERHVAELVGRINERGLAHRLRPLEVIDRGEYGWTRYAESRPCQDEAAAARFHFRQGAYLAIFHALRAYDLHMGNIVADGEHPMFIDLEAIFHAPAEFELFDDVNGERVGAALRDSVLAVGLLPVPTVVVDEQGVRVADFSGLTGGRSGTSARLHRRIGFVGEGTDQMSAVRVPADHTATQNRPWLLDGKVPPVNAGMLESGFRAAYEILAGEQDVVSAFGGDPIRVVLRDTAIYAALLRESWHPDLLRDGLDREHWFELVAVRGALARWPCVTAEERRQLAARDVPLFTCDADGTTLGTHTGIAIPGLFQRSGLSHARQRVQDFSDDDLRQQLWFLRAALATVAGVLRPRLARRARCLPTEPIDAHAAAAAAIAVGNRIVADSLGAEWVSVNRFGDDAWTIGPTDLGLEAGVTGVALFLAELYGITGHAGAKRVVLELLATLLSVDEAPDPEDLSGMSAGCYADLGAVLHLLLRLKTLWGHAAPELPNWLRPAILRNAEPAPSTIFTLMALHAEAPGDDTIEALRRTAKHLRDYVSPASAAWGDRTAQHARALAALADVLDDSELASAAVWLVRTDPDQTPAGLIGNALTGAALLDRSRSVMDRPALEAHLRAVAGPLRDLAVQGTSTDALLGGALGVAEALAAIGATLHQPELVVLAGRCAARVCAGIAAGELVTAVPTGVWNPGLLRGAAGIGHGVLRLAFPGRVSSVLSPA
ncbi:type 2 lanthipeptide synthetase LanM family protein [Actinoplanes sp. NEAU-A12]|uniref:Type 2 lanthipeptide synthetase LanM family protein n=1 Tax=Actinoplanes sandaracinus TaxID=3045177 RepID=A0ABT6WRK9_9ACTN|nr:type 2 lanthipeptide synthetase LanM family protein [Actinoplanes sandaracinus]MDI6102275.1 type 2 lanthipeptide synthetase LanM family protein [Actinoplanes sandaracinus]